MDGKNDQPYCSRCGYSLVGLVDSAKCPECGKPIVEVLVRDSFPGARGYRYRTARRILGLPLVSVAWGPHGSERVGRPVGILALGDQACGLIAFGGVAVGIVAVGGCAFGFLSLGGLSVGACAVGGIAVGLFSYGGIAIAFIRSKGGMMMDLWPW